MPARLSRWHYCDCDPGGWHRAVTSCEIVDYKHCNALYCWDDDNMKWWQTTNDKWISLVLVSRIHQVWKLRLSTKNINRSDTSDNLYQIIWDPWDHRRMEKTSLSLKLHHFLSESFYRLPVVSSSLRCCQSWWYLLIAVLLPGKEMHELSSVCLIHLHN